MKQKSQKKHQQFDGTLAMIILKKVRDTYIILQGISRSSIFIVILFCGKSYFASKLQNSAREKMVSLRRPLAP
jgi:hypothetical protein